MKAILAPAVLLSAVLLSAAPAQTQRSECTATSYGQGCGPVLQADFRPIGATYQFTEKVTNARPQIFGLFMWGTQQLNLPIAGTNCFLLTDFVFGHTYRTDQNGEAVLQRAVPAGVVGAFFSQHVLVDVSGPQMELWTTNGAAIECKLRS